MIQIKKLIICASPRSAGHAFLEHLEASEMGRPAEYFQPDHALKVFREIVDKSCKDIQTVVQNAQAYGEALLLNRSCKDVFSVKIFAYHYHFMKEAIGEENSYFIFLKRRDLFSQVVSNVAIYQTKRPFDNKTEYPSIPRRQANEESVKKIFQLIESENNYWQKFSKTIEEDKKCFVVTEDFLDRPAHFMSLIANQFSLPLPDSYVKNIPANKGRYLQDRGIKDEIIKNHGALIRDLISQSQ
jgi:LPS sulfotransferase NodH